VIARDDVLNGLGVAVAVDNGHNRDVQLVRLGDGEALLATVDDEERTGKPPHVGHSAEVALEAVELVGAGVGLLGAHALEITTLAHGAKLGHTLELTLDDREVS